MKNGGWERGNMKRRERKRRKNKEEQTKKSDFQDDRERERIKMEEASEGMEVKEQEVRGKRVEKSREGRE